MNRPSNGDNLWLITGATGKLGRHVTRCARKYAEVIETSRKGDFGSEKFDLEKTDQIEEFLSVNKPNHIIHLAAVARPSHVEESPERAFRINVAATERIASWCRKHSCFLTFTSTDHVFSSEGAPHSELSVPSPMTSYGRMKAEAEAHVLESGGYVARLGWVIEDRACEDTGFVGNALSLLAKGEDVYATPDELRTPICTSLAARYICHFTNENYRGILHLAGDEHITPFDFVDRLRKHYKIASGNLIKSRLYSREQDALRPKDVRLDNGVLKALLDKTRVDWDFCASE